ncbi:MAG: hypothetical protein AAFN27_09080 [Pseudomonadota bacterium]
MRLPKAFLSVFLVALICGPLFAQASQKLSELSWRSVAGFECATLQHLAKEGSSGAYFTVGVESGREFWRTFEQLGEPESTNTDNIEPRFLLSTQYRELVGVSADFQLGYLWHSVWNATQRAIEELSEETTSRGQTNANTAIALTQIQNRNCEWILK